MRILMIDNYDSFTYNLVQLLGVLGADVRVFRNDKISLAEIEEMAPDKIVISPGPGRPEEAGISCEAIRWFYRRVPILGVCLGHQCLGHVFGMKVVRAPRPMHGKTSQVLHHGQDIYQGVENPFQAMRYHSLVVEDKNLHPDLLVTARTPEGIVMGLRHKRYPLHGIQYHPESFLTPAGEKIMSNFLRI